MSAVIKGNAGGGSEFTLSDIDKIYKTAEKQILNIRSSYPYFNFVYDRNNTCYIRFMAVEHFMSSGWYMTKLGRDYNNFFGEYEYFYYANISDVDSSRLGNIDDVVSYIIELLDSNTLTQWKLDDGNNDAYLANSNDIYTNEEWVKNSGYSNIQYIY